MPIESILFLCLVLGALTVFAAALAYGEWVWKQPPAPRAVDRANARAALTADQPVNSNFKKAA